MQASFLALSAELVPSKSLFPGPRPLSCPSLFDKFYAQLMFPLMVRARQENKHTGISSNIRRVSRILQRTAGQVYLIVAMTTAKLLFSEHLPS
ncbi:hypothetical protein CEXT_657111 [Caerostris extrusa]|uniref:Uncharacterized protein n=1 Tax=Caerostris extrusa TaxID=172846 RepID=A0AAV4MRP8_CAEEX|nr:hypothetical protein CEXT_657111 [Caerostris extrusa]